MSLQSEYQKNQYLCHKNESETMKLFNSNNCCRVLVLISVISIAMTLSAKPAKTQDDVPARLHWIGQTPLSDKPVSFGIPFSKGEMKVGEEAVYHFTYIVDEDMADHMVLEVDQTSYDGTHKYIDLGL